MKEQSLLYIMPKILWIEGSKPINNERGSQYTNH